MKKILYLIILLFLSCCSVKASDNRIYNDIYKEQFKMSGAESLKENMPKESLEILDNLGISGTSWDEISNLTPDKFFEEIINVSKEKTFSPISALVPVIAIILLNAIVDALKISFDNQNMSQIITVVSALCVCICIVTPIVKSISSIALIITCAAGFMLCYIPIMTGVMITSGQSLSATSYHVVMMGAGQIISQISANLLIPIMNTILGISVISAISPRLDLDKLCDLFHKTIKCVLGFSVSTFVGFLTVQSLVTSAADNIGSKTLKFALNNFVPIVGNALSDAFGTVNGCVKLLKSGIGAFGIIAGGAIFLPLIIECGVWIAFLNVCAVIGDMFELKRVCGLLRSSGKVMGTMLAIILCCMMILIVSTVIILIVGGGS